MKKKLAILLLMILGGTLAAHEFWLEPQKFRLKKGETLKVRFRVGERFEGENWQGNRQVVDGIHLYFNGFDDDLSELITDESPGDSISLQFFDEGTGVMSFHSTNKRIELEPAKFLEYLREEGLDSAIAYREQHHETDSVGREYYQRSVKTLFQVGESYDDTYKQNCGLPLEFIPLHNPYHLRKGQQLSMKLLFRDTAVQGARIRIWQRLNGKTNVKETTTDSDGLFTFTPSLNGRYMISTVRMEHMDSSSDTHWQSYWATITWGY